MGTQKYMDEGISSVNGVDVAVIWRYYSQTHLNGWYWATLEDERSDGPFGYPTAALRSAGETL